MDEIFLHYTWKYRLFESSKLLTTKGLQIELIKTGEHNHQSGPDFFNSHLKIDGITWVGNLEIHVNSSHWNLHKHQFDSAYNNVVLHVVYEHDAEIKNLLGQTIPTLELKGLIPLAQFQRYSQLKESKTSIACGTQISSLPSSLMFSWLQRLAIDRLEEKTKVISEILLDSNNDWDETFYKLLAKNFGFKINSFPFYLLAKNLPLKILLKHANNQIQIEALLFGQAGMLQAHLSDKYFQKLQNEYEFLKNKYSLIASEKAMWKFSRMRPANFPTVRIAQFASVIKNFNGLFSKIKDIKTLSLLDEVFNTEPAEFWKNHYLFEKKSITRSKKLGHIGIQNIAINTIVPLLFLYGKITHQERYSLKATMLLEELEAEENKIVKEYNLHGLNATSSLESQAMIQLKNNYCNKQKCLQCTVGYFILKS